MIGQEWKMVIRLFTLPAVMVIALGGLIFWYDGAALAADQIVEQEQAAAPVAIAKAHPIEPLLLPGEDSRFPTAYRGETKDLAVTARQVDQGFLILVNYDHLLPEDYLPEELTVVNDLAEAAKESKFSVGKARLQVNKTAAEQLLAMATYAYEKDGITGYLLQSGHRDFSYQKALYRNKVQYYKSLGYGDGDAVTAAAVWVARPFESEHHTGLAMDVSSRSHPGLQTSYYGTDNGLWLDENCWRFGFVVRYPEDKTDITKIGYEPWHLRYLGRPHSDYIYQQGWCLEEYYDFLYREGGYTFRDAEGAIWQVDYQPLGSGAIKVPAHSPYTISGDGSKGFVITTLLEPISAAH